MIQFGFWKKLKRPIITLAPMADVTDFAFREIIAKCGAPDVFWTEFVSADGLCSEKGRPKLLIDLKFSPKQKPIVAQIFTANPHHAERAAELCTALGFQGVDINMGCPDRKVERQGAGAALIKNPALAREVLLATKKGAGKLPVSVKTRIGYSKNELSSWLPYLFEAEPALITIHARTRNEMSKVPARWEHIAEAVRLRDSYFQKDKPLIFGNGDLVSVSDAKEKTRLSGADGAMLGRAIFGNPWLFTRKKKILEKERFLTLVRHTELFEKTFTGIKSFDVMKKHFKAYVLGFRGAHELRMNLMKTQNASEVKKIITQFLIHNS
jgi:nifR3 family TIM-barrel protein